MGANLSWINISKYKDLFLFRVHAAWLVFIPIISKILAVFLLNVFTIDTCPPHIWLVLYLAALAIFTARIIFEVRCPKIIKEHPSFATFASMQLSPLHIKKELCLDFPDSDVDREYLLRFKTGRSQFSPDNNDGELSAYFNYAIDALSETRALSRRACVLFYGVGMALISYYVLGNIVCQLRTL